MGGKDKMYDSRLLAKFFGVSEETVWEWCKTGKLPAFKIGKKWRVRVSDLQKIIDGKVQTRKPNRARLF
jgi:excisionase family DNA binding protein